VLAICGLERGVATDVDQLEIERLPAARLGDDVDRAVTQVAALRVVDRDRSQRRCAGRRRRVGWRGQG
jgi:hypothetical protein